MSDLPKPKSWDGLREAIAAMPAELLRDVLVTQLQSQPDGEVYLFLQDAIYLATTRLPNGAGNGRHETLPDAEDGGCMPSR